MGKHLLILPIIFAALTAGCGNTAPSGTSTDASPAPLPANSFMQKWTADINPSAGAIVRVYAREDLLFAYTANSQSYVINRQTGRLLHVDSIPAQIVNVQPPVLIKDSIIYITLNSMEMFERESGKFVRTVRLPLAVRTGAVADKGDLFLGAEFPGGGRVVKLDATRQWVPIVWGLMFPNSAVTSTPAVFNDVVYAGAEDGRVAAVAAESREAVWSFGFFETGGPIYADLQADETGLYIAGGDSKFYCLNRSSGKVKWQYFAGAALKATPALTSDLVLEFVDGAGLVALDKAPPVLDGKPALQYDRQPRWVVAGATQFLASDKSFIYAAMTDGSIGAIDKATGQIAFTSKRSDFAAWCINTKDAVIYAATTGGRVIAVVPVSTAGIVGTMVQTDSPSLNSQLMARAAN